MNEPTASVRDAVTHRCITCADEGRVAALLEDGLADVHFTAGGSEHVALDLVGEIAIGDGVLVHAGVALVKLER